MSSENGSAAGSRLPIEQAETLLRSLTGVLLARIIADDHGHIHEVRVLGDDQLASGQIARNVQSALLVRFGRLVDIDRIIVSTTPAGTRGGATSDATRANGHASGNPVDTAATTPRVDEDDRDAGPLDPTPRLDHLEIERSHGQYVQCRATIVWAGRRLSGSAECIDGPDAHVSAAAGATIAALNAARRGPALELEGVRIADIAGRLYATVAVRTWNGRAIRYLAGAAPIEHSAADAAALAAAQAAAPLLDAREPRDRERTRTAS